MLNLFIPNQKNNYKPYLLRNGALIAYTLFLFLFNSFSGLLGLNKAYASTITAPNIVSLTNAERTKYGLNTLKSNSKLASAALAKANNMFKLQYWSHYGPNGETPWEFIKSSGYTYIYAGENLAKGFKSAEGVTEAWMASPTHRDNILSGNYKEIGVAVVSGRLLGEDVILVVQMFGNQTNEVSATPKPDITQSQTESGQTMSIKITSPKDGSVINDANVNIKGSVTNSSSQYTVLLSQGEENLGNTQSEGKTWEWDKQSDWSEGKQKVVAQLENYPQAKDSVSFTVDTKGPNIEDFIVENRAGVWNITCTISDIDGTVNIVFGDNNISLSSDGKGVFTGEISGLNKSEKVTLVSSDKYGNITQKDISEYFESSSQGSVLSIFINSINSINAKDTINGIFLGFVLILVLIEVFTYWRKKMLAKHGGNLFTLGFWWIILCIGVVSGFSGAIT